jgi:hypothetical protein
VGGAVEGAWGCWIGNLFDAHDNIHASIVTDA